MAYVFNSVERLRRPDRGTGEALAKNVGSESAGGAAPGSSNTSKAPSEFTKASPLAGASQAIISQNRGQNTGVGQVFQQQGQQEFQRKRDALNTQERDFRQQNDPSNITKFNSGWLNNLTDQKTQNQIQGVLGAEANPVAAFNPGVTQESDALKALRSTNVGESLRNQRASRGMYSKKMGALDNALFRQATPERREAVERVQGLQTDLGGRIQSFIDPNAGLQRQYQDLRNAEVTKQKQAAQGSLQGLRDTLIRDNEARAARYKQDVEARNKQSASDYLKKFNQFVQSNQKKLLDAEGQARKLGNQDALQRLGDYRRTLEGSKAENFMNLPTVQDAFGETTSQTDIDRINAINSLLGGGQNYQRVSPVAGPSFDEARLQSQVAGLDDLINPLSEAYKRQQATIPAAVQPIAGTVGQTPLNPQVPTAEQATTTAASPFVDKFKDAGRMAGEAINTGLSNIPKPKIRRVRSVF